MGYMATLQSGYPPCATIIRSPIYPTNLKNFAMKSTKFKLNLTFGTQNKKYIRAMHG